MCLSPVLLVLSSFARGLAEPHPPLPGLAWMGVAAAVGLLNLWYSFGRWWLHVKRGRAPETFRHSTGVPGLGTLLVVLGCCVSFGSIATAALGLAVLAMDTGGTPWFLAATWKDESLWSGA